MTNVTEARLDLDLQHVALRNKDITREGRREEGKDERQEGERRSTRQKTVYKSQDRVGQTMNSPEGKQVAW